MNIYQNPHYAPATTAVWAYSTGMHHQQQAYMTPQQIMAAYQHHPQYRAWAARGVAGHKSTDSKPRLAKDEVERLEAEFQKNPKPNGSLKKGLAEQMRVDIARINNWFQNRRAKAKQEKRTAEFEAQQKLDKDRVEPHVQEFLDLDLEHSDALRSSSVPLPPAADDEPASPARPVEHEIPLSGSSPSAHPASPESVFGNAHADHQPFPGYSVDEQYYGPVSPPAFSGSAASDASSVDGAQAAYTDYCALMMPSYDPASLFNAAADGQLDQSRDGAYQHASSSSPESLIQSPPPPPSRDSRFQSPSSIASRRNAPRPAPLGLHSLRQPYLPPAPKTVDGSRMSHPLHLHNHHHGNHHHHHHHHADSMRRVSSSGGGAARIHKAVSASPLSPYVDRKSEMLLQMARSPPTPGTPVLAGGRRTALAAASFPLQYSLGDATLKTPPTSPGDIAGISGALFGIDATAAAGYAYEEPPLSAFGSDDYAGLSSTASVSAMSGYVTGSQPSTPSFAPSHSGMSVGPVVAGACQFYPQGSASDYGWAESVSVPSARSSPGLPRPRQYSMQFTFNNSTPDDYTGA